MRGKVKILAAILISAFSSAFLIGRVFVYDTNIAHPGLTKLAAELYNQNNSRKLSAEEIGWLVKGAVDEDYPLRWMNHFYDPVHNRGLKGAYDTAKKWAVNPQNQSNYSLGDYSWQRALYEYQRGNKKEAFLALGHILHLLEDLTVPAHTRDDAHPDGDPYEQWVKANFKPVTSQPIYFKTLGEYFDYLANYSNQNFYSEDTIESRKYKGVLIVKESWEEIGNNKIRRYFFASDGSVVFKLMVSTQDFDWQDRTLNIKMKTVRDDNVQFDHFSLLAPKAVGAGAGLIKFFFEEAQKPLADDPAWLWQTSPLGYFQQTLGYLVKEAEPLYEKAKDLVISPGGFFTQFNFVSELIKTQSALAQNLEARTSAAVLAALNAEIKPDAVIPLVQNTIKNLARNISPAVGKAAEIIKSPKPADRPVVSPSLQLPPTVFIEPAPLPTFFPIPPSASSPPQESGKAAPKDSPPSSFSGGGVSSGQISSPPPTPPSETVSVVDNQAQSPPDTIPPAPPIIIQPSSSPVWTTSSTYQLITELSPDTFKFFFNAEPIETSSTVWSREAELAEGENIFNLTAEDLAGNRSATTSVKITKDSIAPTAGFQSIVVSPDNQIINLFWSADDGAGSGAASYDLEYSKQEIGAPAPANWLPWFSAATSTRAIFAAEAGYQYKFRVRAADQLGNIGEWAESETKNINLPRVVINEIAWAGTKAQANDEWMELYNLEDYEVDLSGWSLGDGNDLNFVFASSSAIAARGFFLLERTNDETVSTITADAIYTGSLRNSGEDLALKDAEGRLIDEARAGNKWFAGGVGRNVETMERKDPSVSGNLASNWQTAPFPPRNGLDFKGNPITGTPRRPNSSFTYLDGSLLASRVITAEHNPYFLGNLTVPAGIVLTIGKGVVFKSRHGWIYLEGEIRTNGTVGEPVVFTSYRDTSYYGDTNTWRYGGLDGAKNPIEPDHGDWGRLFFKTGAAGVLKNTILVYGNHRPAPADPNGAIVADGAEISAAGLSVSTSTPAGDLYAVNLANSSSTFSGCEIKNNFNGLKVSGGQAAVFGCLIENNSLRALFSSRAKIVLEENSFINNGWGIPKQYSWGGYLPGPMVVEYDVPKTRGNHFGNNIHNGLEWLRHMSNDFAEVDNSEDWPWLVGGVTILPGSAIEIKAGSRFKIRYLGFLAVNGALSILGTAEKPVVFTSWRDDSDGYDSNGDGSETAPNPGGLEWYQMRLDSRATSTLTHLAIHYANQQGWANQPGGALYIENTPVEIDHLTLEHSRIPGAALYLKNANQAKIKNSLIKNHSKFPLYRYTTEGIVVDGGAPLIESTTIDTFNFGVRRKNNGQPLLSEMEYINVDLPVVN